MPTAADLAALPPLLEMEWPADQVHRGVQVYLQASERLFSPQEGMRVLAWDGELVAACRNTAAALVTSVDWLTEQM